MPYDHKNTEDISTGFGTDAYQPQYAFGEGLSYTSFTYSKLALSESSISGDAPLTVSVGDVKNTGDRAGKESVLVYVGIG